MFSLKPIILHKGFLLIENLINYTRQHYDSMKIYHLFVHKKIRLKFYQMVLDLRFSFDWIITLNLLHKNTSYSYNLGSQIKQNNQEESKSEICLLRTEFVDCCLV